MGDHKYTATGPDSFVVTKGEDKTPLHTFPTEGEAKMQVDHLDAKAEEDAKAEKEKAKKAKAEPDPEDEDELAAKIRQGFDPVTGKYNTPKSRHATAKHKTATKRSVPKHKVRKHK
jgi:hypothetical protein